MEIQRGRVPEFTYNLVRIVEDRDDGRDAK